MADASYTRSSFVGGEWSKFAQGRYHDPKYLTALNVCQNGIPLESENWVRRPGFGFLQTTRSGMPGRLIAFDFEQSNPYMLEFTDGHLRFFSDRVLVSAESSLVTSISTATPAVVQTTMAQTWVTGDQVYFSGLFATSWMLQNRVFTINKVDTTHFGITDAITGTPIDGSVAGVGSPAVTATIHKVIDLPTPYVGGSWSSLRAVQTDTTAFLLDQHFPPYGLNVIAEPTSTTPATFEILPAIFNDGPYLDPFNNGAQVNPSGIKGIITLDLSFPAWDTTLAYAKGAFVVSVNICYESLVDQNVGQLPASHPAFWQTVSAGEAVQPGGFSGSDVGRLVRLFSEPPLWVAGSYSAGNVVSYNPSGLPGQTTYWQSKTSSNTAVPGADVTNWEILAQGGTSSPALWTWGRITGLSTKITSSLGTNIGDMTEQGGLAAAFDDVLTQVFSASAAKTTNGGFAPPSSLINFTFDNYVGKDYTGIPKQIAQVIIYPSSDTGFLNNSHFVSTNDITFTLRGNASAPGSASDGTVLSTINIPSNQTSPVSLVSIDQTTAWNYVWIEINGIVTGFDSFNPNTIGVGVSELVLFGPPGSGTSGSGISVEILGPPLLYNATIRTWRLGVYSWTTGWPTCGTYSDGRLWLGGAIGNRFDASVSNDRVDGTVNFAPTDQYGNVLASSAISYVFNSNDINPIFWMMPELQGIVCGTKGGEFLITAPTAGGITPLNIAARRVTRQGCADIEPRRTEHTIVFVQKFQRQLIEYFADVFSGKYTAPNLAANALHLTKGNIDELAYQQQLCPIVWVRVDGKLRGMTYRRDTLMTSQGPSIVGWHPHVLGSGRTVESIAVGASVGGTLDSLFMVTNDPATGIRHVELLGEIVDEASTLEQAFYLDDAVTPTSTSSSNIMPAPYGGLTLNGLWHLNGQSVQAWLGGLDCGDYLVANGAITVPYGDGVSAGTANGLFTADFVASFTTMPMWVGFTYTSDGQLTRPHTPQESGARSGPALGKKRRNQYIIAQLEGTQGVSFGTTFTHMKPAIFKQDNGTVYLINEQFNGVFRDQFYDEYSYDGMICWRITRPYPCNIEAIGGALQTQDI